MIFFYAMVLFQLLFKPETLYSADSLVCKGNEMQMEVNGDVFPVSLFNIDYKEGGYLEACSLIEEASAVTFEFDSSVNQDSPFLLWIFLDGKLLQETLLERGKADILIANPTYKYMDECLKARQGSDTMAIQGFYHAGEDSGRGIYLCAALSAFTVIYASGLTCCLVRSRKNKRISADKNQQAGK